MTEQDHIKALQAGNATAFNLLMEQQQARVLNICFNYVRHTEEAEDLAQEVFVEVYNSIKKFDGRSSLSTWIYRIAVNKSLDHIKAGKRKKRFGIVLSIFGGETDYLESGFKAPKPIQPDEQLEQQEMQRTLKRALDNIPENQATVFRLSKIDGMKQQEIADILETSVSAVESLMHRAKKNLRAELEGIMKKNNG